MPNMELILALLAAASVLAGLARRINVPYPIVLVVGGALLALVPGLPEITIAPNVVFLVFLPPLLYAAGMSLSPTEVRHNFGPIMALAIGLVLATVVAVAVVVHLLIGIPWSLSFALGAILGATDPIAATAIIHRLGAPQRIATLLEGEALINDGTSLTAFKVAVTALTAGSFSLLEGIGEFVVVAAGGAAIGAAVGWVSTLIRSQFDDANLEIAVGIVSCYGAYIIADRVGTSGVLAAVVAGFMVNLSSHRIFSAGTRLRSNAFWEVIEFILNALLFLLIGLELRSAVKGIQNRDAGQLIVDVVAVVGVMVVLRIASMYVVPALVPRLRRQLPGGQVRTSMREQLVLGFSGMRGALSVAAALSLPATIADSSGRSLVIFLAFAATLITLVVPGLTLAPLIRRLGLGQTETQMRQGLRARQQIARAALEHLDWMAEHEEMSEQILSNAREQYEIRLEGLAHRLGEDDGAGDSAQRAVEQRALRDRLISVQRRALRDLALERAAPTQVLREIERELDQEASL